MKKRHRARWVAIAPFFPLAVALHPSCSLGEGRGSVTGALDIDQCWTGCFDLRPDFFAAVPYNSTLDIRIQSGGDFETFSDGIDILVDDVHPIRGDGQPGQLDRPLAISLPPGVTEPGVPIMANANPAPVHLALYLQRTCMIQNVAVYALSQVTLNPDGTCGESLCAGNDASASDAGDAATDACGAGTRASTAPTGQSTITFHHLFDGNPDEANAAERLTEGSFDVYLADPREVCPGGLGPPPHCRGHLTGTFSFYFERGRPAQPFP